MSYAWFHSRKHGLLSLGVSLLAVFFFCSLIFVPLLERYERYELELVRDGRQMQSLLAISASRDELERAFSDYQARGMENWLYESRETEVVELDIQRRVSGLLADQGVTVRTVSSVQGVQKDGYKAVGVRVLVHGDLKSILGVFATIEQARPLLLAKDIRLTPLPVGRGDEGRHPQSLEAEMSVLTFLPVEPGAEETL